MAACAVCGALVDDAPVSLPEPQAPPDFDTRPGEPLRSTIGLWVGRCRDCGYCAPDLTLADERAPAIIASESYREILGHAMLASKAREFLAFAHLLEKLHQFADAGWSALHAAWVCDDDRDPVSAEHCRATAIDLWKRGKQVGQLFCDGMASEFALITDVYRRMGEFEQATVACTEGLDLEDLPPAVESMLRHQLVLIQRRDTGPHSMSELVGMHV
jgi:hypothetical protein